MMLLLHELIDMIVTCKEALLFLRSSCVISFSFELIENRYRCHFKELNSRCCIVVKIELNRKKLTPQN